MSRIEENHVERDQPLKALELEPSKCERLLARWTKIEPERCVPKDGYFETPKQDTGDSMLLGALIEAIIARDWCYVIYNIEVSPRHKAEVIAGKIIGANAAYAAKGDTPVDALLAAYVAALESIQAGAFER